MYSDLYASGRVLANPKILGIQVASKLLFTDRAVNEFGIDRYRCHKVCHLWFLYIFHSMLTGNDASYVKKHGTNSIRTVIESIKTIQGKSLQYTCNIPSLDVSLGSRLQFITCVYTFHFAFCAWLTAHDISPRLAFFFFICHFVCAI